ncbi:LysM domain-containing protein [Opitutaceae bacterium TAV1]|nr:LysM domain-containing protein [Opitutaceae bacterium TAV1]
MRRFSFSRRLLLALFVLAALAGCEPRPADSYTAEVDEPAFRRGKELVRQGRDGDALKEFLKVIAERGDDNAPESHLEAGILYQRHMKDPLAAIYHYRRFRDLRVNSPQAEKVRGQIEAAIREFARTVPSLLTENQSGNAELQNEIDALRRENNQLKTERETLRLSLQEAARRAQAPLATPPSGESAGGGNTSVALTPVQPDGYISPPLSPAPPAGWAQTPPQPSTRLPAQPARQQQTVQPASRPPGTATMRSHVVTRGDTLYSLAQRYYNNRSRWRDILAANQDQLASENTPLRIGMELRIPQ